MIDPIWYEIERTLEDFGSVFGNYLSITTYQTTFLSEYFPLFCFTNHSTCGLLCLLLHLISQSLPHHSSLPLSLLNFLCYIKSARPSLPPRKQNSTLYPPSLLCINPYVDSTLLSLFLPPLASSLASCYQYRIPTDIFPAWNLHSATRPFSQDSGVFGRIA